MRKPSQEYLDNCDGVCTWPDDVAKLKEDLPELRALSDVEIEALYTQWSQEEYCAGWMNLGSVRLQLFGKWLNEG